MYTIHNSKKNNYVSTFQIGVTDPDLDLSSCIWTTGFNRKHAKTNIYPEYQCSDYRLESVWPLDPVPVISFQKVSNTC